MKTLPFDYAVRNLGRSRLRLAMGVLGSALVVLLVIAAGAFVRGMSRSLTRSGSEKNVILLGAGSEESIERSQISASVATQVAASVPGLRSEAGAEFVSPEVHMALGIQTELDVEAKSQAVFRGVTPAAFRVHPQVQIVEGRTFEPGADEVIVGALAATRLGVPEQALTVGRRIRIDDREWTVVGRFAAPNTVMNAEVWCPLANLQILTRRDSLSCVVVTLDTAEFADLDAFAVTRLDLELAAIPETEYYRQLTAFYRPVRTMVWGTALLIGLGGILGGLNTMYAAFASRTREVGMLQSLGYTRYAIITSFVQESWLTACAGTLIGCALSLVLLDSVSVRISMGAFGLSVDGPVLLLGMLSGMILGITGALPPAIRCLGLPITEAMKAV